MPKSILGFKTIQPGNLTKNESRLWRAMYENDLYSHSKVAVAGQTVLAGRYTRLVDGSAEESEVTSAAAGIGREIFSFSFEGSSASIYKASLTIPYIFNTDAMSLPSFDERPTITAIFTFDGTSSNYHQFVCDKRAAISGYYGPNYFSSIRDGIGWGLDSSADHSCIVSLVVPKELSVGASETAPIFFTFQEIKDGN